MEQYVALDVSLKEISVCVIDGKGAVTFEGKAAAEPAALIGLIRSKAPQAARVGLETGATSSWLYHALKAADLPVALMDALTRGEVGFPPRCGSFERSAFWASGTALGHWRL